MSRRMWTEVGVREWEGGEEWSGAGVREERGEAVGACQ